MKKMIAFSLLLIASVASFGQQTNETTQLSKQDYLQKSKHQKTAAWLLLGGGTVLVTIGGLINAHEVYDPYSFDRNYSNKGTPLTIAGTLAIAGSIPLFIVAAKNKKKAMSLSLKNETVPQFYKQSIVSLPLPSLNIKIGL